MTRGIAFTEFSGLELHAIKRVLVIESAQINIGGFLKFQVNQVMIEMGGAAAWASVHSKA
jgi:hypothetical protein